MLQTVVKDFYVNKIIEKKVDYYHIFVTSRDIINNSHLKLV